jgi:hypothetical protein
LNWIVNLPESYSKYFIIFVAYKRVQ